MSSCGVMSTVRILVNRIHSDKYCDPRTFTVVRIKTSPVNGSNNVLAVPEQIVFATRLTYHHLLPGPAVNPRSNTKRDRHFMSMHKRYSHYGGF